MTVLGSRRYETDDIRIEGSENSAAVWRRVLLTVAGTSTALFRTSCLPIFENELAVSMMLPSLICSATSLMLLNKDEEVTARDGLGRWQRRRTPGKRRHDRGDEMCTRVTRRGRWCARPTMAVVDGCCSAAVDDTARLCAAAREAIADHPTGSSLGHTKDSGRLRRRRRRLRLRRTASRASERQRRSCSDSARCSRTARASDCVSTLPAAAAKADKWEFEQRKRTARVVERGLVHTTTTEPGRRGDGGGPDDDNDRERYNRRHNNVRPAPRNTIYTDSRPTVSADT